MEKRPCEICGKAIVWAGGSRGRHLNAHVDRDEAFAYFRRNPGNKHGGYYVYVRKEK